MLLALEQRQVCTQARKATHGLDGQLIKTWTGLPVEESIRMTEDRDEWRKYVHGVADPRIEDGYKNTTEQCYRNCIHSTRGRVYETGERPSGRLSVCLSRRAAGLLLSTVRAGKRYPASSTRPSFHHLQSERTIA